MVLVTSLTSCQDLHFLYLVALIDEAIWASCVERYIRKETGPETRDAEIPVCAVTHRQVSGSIVGLWGAISGINMQKSPKLQLFPSSMPGYGDTWWTPWSHLQACAQFLQEILDLCIAALVAICFKLICLPDLSHPLKHSSFLACNLFMGLRLYRGKSEQKSCGAVASGKRYDLKFNCITLYALWIRSVGLTDESGHQTHLHTNEAHSRAGIILQLDI